MRLFYRVVFYEGQDSFFVCICQTFYSIYNNDVNTVRGETKWENVLQCAEWIVRTLTRTVLTSDESFFYIRADLDAFEGEKRLFCKSWDKKIKRELV